MTARKIIGAKSSKIPLTSSMLKILVGNGANAREFAIHESLLTARAVYFSKAMSKGWKEAEAKLVELADDDADAFDLYQQLVYTDRIPLLEAESTTSHEHECPHRSTCQLAYTSLAKLYVLAEKLQDVKARNSAVQAVISQMENESKSCRRQCLPGPAAVKIMYEGTPGHCAGRQVLVDCYVYHGNEYSISVNIPDGDILPEFLLDLSSTLLRCRARDHYESPACKKERYLEDESGKGKWNMQAWRTKS